ncbi:LPXTG-site transpeptidase (sortase) family protein [Actinacidiphila rubida]|uniref:LPXTG-site transpeptidase (Sortase) family protein n=2 Tax=Actinacidiphila rubida TaxID=310780 RepID=A0A1H8UA61_9ACTN|nr:class E sortase [Actinacidiphila rubida]SEO99927.1 LPXTG-site transpeptidase (sortase) family protein [Actinacidiphila rubida]
MAVLSPTQPAAAPPQEPAAPPPGGRGQADLRFVLPGAALTLLAVLLLGFAANLTVLGHIEHARAQQSGYDQLRSELAQGTAPVGRLDMNGKEVPSGSPVAVLHIPALKLREVVFQGTTSGVLTKGPGHLRNTPLPGQPGTSTILGRQWGYGSPFNHLDELKAGDPITVTTGQGQQHYQVTGIRRAGDPAPAALQNGQGRLTLITATGGAYTPHGVLRVDATLVGTAQPAPAAGGLISTAERPLEGDPSAWLPVMLWLQALLIVVVAATWAFRRWGRWQTWIAGVPVLVAIVVALSGAATELLPNLL